MRRALECMAYSLVGLDNDFRLGHSRARLVILLVYASLFAALGMGTLSSPVVLDFLLFDSWKRSLLFVVRIQKKRRTSFGLYRHLPLAEWC